MKRKVIKQRDSYTVTLPKKWVEEHGVPKELNIEEEKEGLFIRTEAMPRKEGDIKIDSRNEQFIVYILNNAYRSGYDFLRIHIPNKRIAEIIEQRLPLLLGWQIVQKKEKEIIIENLTEPRIDKFDVLFRRMFLIIKEDLENIKEIQTEEVMKIDNFCRRCIAKRIIGKEKIHVYWQFLSMINWVHRSLYYLTKEGKPGKEHQVLQKKILEAFTNLYEGFFEKDFRKIALVFDITNEIMQNKKKYLSKESNITYYFIEMTRLINRSCSPCIGILV